jgi:carbon-monoxide dehydrogenase large subunit
VDIEAAKQAPGVAAVLIASDINPRCEPFIGVALHRPGHRSAPQRLLAADRAVWQGEPVAVVVADRRAAAEAAAELVTVDWQPLPVVAISSRPSLRAPTIHPGSPTTSRSISRSRRRARQGVRRGRPRDRGGAPIERQMAMTLEARGLIADFDRAKAR